MKCLHWQAEIGDIVKFCKNYGQLVPVYLVYPKWHSKPDFSNPPPCSGGQVADLTIPIIQIINC
jgi:hypothetical protein